MHMSMKPPVLHRIAPPEPKPVTQARPRTGVQAVSGDRGEPGSRQGQRRPPHQDQAADGGAGAGPRTAFAALLAKHDMDTLG